MTEQVRQGEAPSPNPTEGQQVGERGLQFLGEIGGFKKVQTRPVKMDAGGLGLCVKKRTSGKNQSHKKEKEKWSQF